MIRVQLVAVTADSSPLFRPTGSVNNWSHVLARDIRRAARERTPGGTPGRSRARHGTWARGRLAASFYTDVDAFPSARIINVEVGNTSGHARYVHDGTANAGTGYIYTSKGFANRALVDTWITSGIRPDRPGYLMPVTRIPGRTRHYLRVRGQFPNPFLRDGLEAALRRHRLL
jgi:hypothetical protein